MSITSAQLQRLIAELNQVNQELADAAHPPKRLSDLNEGQRQAICDDIRAGLARWESIKRRIGKTLNSSPSQCL